MHHTVYRTSASKPLVGSYTGGFDGTNDTEGHLRKENNVSKQNCFWQFNADNGFHAKAISAERKNQNNIPLKASIHSYGNSINQRYQRRVLPIENHNASQVHDVKPARSNSFAHSNHTPKTVPMTVFSTSAITNEKTILHNNQQKQPKIGIVIDQKKNQKRLLEQQLRQQIQQRQTYYSNSQTTNHQNTVSNVNVQQQHNISRPVTPSHERPPASPSVEALPPVSYIEFKTGSSLVIDSPIFSPIASMKRQNALSIHTNAVRLKSLSLPLNDTNHTHIIIDKPATISKPIINNTINNYNKKSMTNPIISSSVGEEKIITGPNGKLRKVIVRKVLVRKDDKNKNGHNSSINKDQERIIAEKEAEIKRIENRLAELKLRREIKALEDELKNSHIQTGIETTSPSNLLSADAHETRENNDPLVSYYQQQSSHLSSKQILAAIPKGTPPIYPSSIPTHTTSSTNPIKLNGMPPKPTWVNRPPQTYQSKTSLPAKLNETSQLKRMKSITGGSKMNNISLQKPKCSPKNTAQNQPLIPVTQAKGVLNSDNNNSGSRNNTVPKKITATKKSTLSENFRRMQQSLVSSIHNRNAGKHNSNNNNKIKNESSSSSPPKKLSPEFRKIQQNLLMNMKTSGTNPHYKP